MDKIKDVFISFFELSINSFGFFTHGSGSTKEYYIFHRDKGGWVVMFDQPRFDHVWGHQHNQTIINPFRCHIDRGFEDDLLRYIPIPVTEMRKYLIEWFKENKDKVIWEVML